MSRDFRLRENIPFVNGVYVAINAVTDAVLVVDGPYCVIWKLQMQSGHDLSSTLLSPEGPGRVVMTDVRRRTNVVYNVATDRGADILDVMRKAASLPGAGIVVLTSMDFNHLLAEPLDLHAGAVERETGMRVVRVHNESLDGDWLTGYARVLERLASAIDLPDAAPEPGAIAVVGHMMDRGEGDQRGNVEEMARLVRGAGLDVASVWLSGSPVASLAEARRAAGIVSLPYGREAARTLAGRLGVPVVEARLPLGLAATGDFVRAVARAAGREGCGDAFVEAELSRVVPAIRPHAFRFLARRRVVVEADPHLALALAGLLDELGMEVAAITVVGEAAHLDEEGRARLSALGARFEPPVAERPALPAPADVRIASSLYPDRGQAAEWVPLGYPNYASHPVALAPFLGFAGVVGLVERLTEAVMRAEIRLQAGHRPPV